MKNKRTEEYCQQQSIRQKDRVITPEWKNKISNSLKGRPSPNKPKQFIEYKNKIYSFKDFSLLIGCSLNYLYSKNKEIIERKFICKFLIK